MVAGPGQERRPVVQVLDAAERHGARLRDELDADGLRDRHSLFAARLEVLQARLLVLLRRLAHVLVVLALDLRDVAEARGDVAARAPRAVARRLPSLDLVRRARQKDASGVALLNKQSRRRLEALLEVRGDDVHVARQHVDADGAQLAEGAPQSVVRAREPRRLEAPRCGLERFHDVRSVVHLLEGLPDRVRGVANIVELVAQDAVLVNISRDPAPLAVSARRSLR